MLINNDFPKIKYIHIYIIYLSKIKIFRTFLIIVIALPRITVIILHRKIEENAIRDIARKNVRQQFASLRN